MLCDLQRFHDNSFSFQSSGVVTRKTFVGIIFLHDDDFLVTDAPTSLGNKSMTLDSNGDTAETHWVSVTDATTQGLNTYAPTSEVVTSETWSTSDKQTSSHDNSITRSFSEFSIDSTSTLVGVSTTEPYTEVTSEHFKDSTLKYQTSTVNDKIYFPSD